jgi:hypothetical protein
MTGLPLQTLVIKGDSYEKWKKETTWTAADVRKFEVDGEKKESGTEHREEPQAV